MVSLGRFSDVRVGRIDGHELNGSLLRSLDDQSDEVSPKLPQGSSAADYESGGRRFESFRARQKSNKYKNNLNDGKGAMQNKIICMASAWPRGA
jgi:hypothetical protein